MSGCVSVRLPRCEFFEKSNGVSLTTCSSLEVVQTQAMQIRLQAKKMPYKRIRRQGTKQSLEGARP